MRISTLELTGVSYKWYASAAGLPNLYSVIDGSCTLKVENNCNTENTLYMKQAVIPGGYAKAPNSKLSFHTFS